MTGSDNNCSASAGSVGGRRESVYIIKTVMWLVMISKQILSDP